jgi:hypothetical protein
MPTSLFMQGFPDSVTAQEVSLLFAPTGGCGQWNLQFRGMPGICGR